MNDLGDFPGGSSSIYSTTRIRRLHLPLVVDSDWLGLHVGLSHLDSSLDDWESCHCEREHAERGEAKSMYHVHD